MLGRSMEFIKLNKVELYPNKLGRKGYAKTFRKLEQVADSQNAQDLLIKIGRFNEAGSRTREENVQRIAAFLRWATSKDSEYLLDEESMDSSS